LQQKVNDSAEGSAFQRCTPVGLASCNSWVFLKLPGHRMSSFIFHVTKIPFFYVGTFKGYQERLHGSGTGNLVPDPQVLCRDCGSAEKPRPIAKQKEPLLELQRITKKHKKMDHGTTRKQKKHKNIRNHNN
jgi:hypothetical protein